jgi:hypothetical protein
MLVIASLVAGLIMFNQLKLHQFEQAEFVHRKAVWHSLSQHSLSQIVRQISAE